jgi:hypothetical protein
MDAFVLPDHPFPGLHAFDPKHTDLFFGRDEEIDQLIGKLRVHRFVGVVGVSGIGKSSLVRAGLIPAPWARRHGGASTGWRTVIVRPGNALSEPWQENWPPAPGLDERSCGQRVASLKPRLRRLAGDHLAADQDLLIWWISSRSFCTSLVPRYRCARRTTPLPGGKCRTWPPGAEEATEFVTLLLGATGYGPIEREGEEKPPVFVVLTHAFGVPGQMHDVSQPRRP